MAVRASSQRRGGTGDGISLPSEVRDQVVGELLPRLYDALHLYTQLKHAHWNVTGPNFSGLHALFDDVAAQSLEWSDLLAERVRQLGRPAPGDLRAAASGSTLASYPEDASTWEAHVAAVAGALGQFATNIRAAIDRTDEAGDKGTADICTEISLAVDKALWFVRSHAP